MLFVRFMFWSMFVIRSAHVSMFVFWARLVIVVFVMVMVARRSIIMLWSGLVMWFMMIVVQLVDLIVFVAFVVA